MEKKHADDWAMKMAKKHEFDGFDVEKLAPLLRAVRDAEIKRLEDRIQTLEAALWEIANAVGDEESKIVPGNYYAQNCDCLYVAKKALAQP